jgi:RHS repeat-associated protein
MYDYDAFGTPVRGSFSGGLTIGYAGKQFDRITGMYNYGYRDYAPSEARFTTIDPIRDGTNWFSYVHNDPVNYVDLWGLKIGQISAEYDYTQQDAQWKDEKLGTSTISVEKEGCKVTAAAEIISTILDETVNPGNVAKNTDGGGFLTQAAVANRMESEGIIIETDYWEKGLTPEKLTEIKNSEDTVYIIAKADLGGGLGEHWVVITDVNCVNGVVTYTVSGTSVNDKGRVYSSMYALNNTGRYGVITKIETYTVKGINDKPVAEIIMEKNSKQEKNGK